MAFQVFNWKIIKGLCCFIFLFMLGLCDASRKTIKNEELKLKKISSGLYNTPLKSIKSPDGDTIDCVHIYHQPAFDNPLLKNHTIQMKPSHYPKELFRKSNMSAFKPHRKNDTQNIIQLWQLNGKCPEGTIPIRRTKEEDLLRDSSSKKKLKGILQHDDELHKYAAITTTSRTFYGGKATINSWRPYVQDNEEFSLSQIWIVGGSGSSFNSIEAGWMVYPDLMGDNNSRFFIYWTRDNYQSTGCYNLLCSGFVQTSSHMAVGGSLAYVSTYHGPQFEVDILVWKDATQGLWWLRFDNEDIGYWPTSLFTILANHATKVQWGGEVAPKNSSGPYTTTHMGSGHFPEEGFGGASYFRNLHVIDQSVYLRPPGQVSSFVVNPNCYNMHVGQDDDWGYFFFYGGPGRNPNCLYQGY